MSVISTPVTELFKIRHPILLAGMGSSLNFHRSCMGELLLIRKLKTTGMNVASGSELAAAVTNYGGLGVIGGHGYTPKVLRQQVRHIPFLGVH
jgi:NAD(P)H-dependent flavin oxidoreductase YrpB (nitropropane dioxygenase family)